MGGGRARHRSERLRRARPLSVEGSQASASVDRAVAAIDCGTNSTRLLIAAGDGRTLDRRMLITRLGAGVDRSGRLQPAAIRRTLDVLEEYQRAISAASVVNVRAVATSALRDAANAPSFLDPAALALGTELDVLSGVEEGRLSYRGATSELSREGDPYLVVDVGGGSTELAVELDGRIVSYSMQLGCVRVSERALGRGVVTSESDAAARAMIALEIDRAFGAQPAFRDVVANVRLVGLAGTVATLAQLDAGLLDYDRDVVHHRVLSRSTVQHWRDLLSRELPEERLQHPGMVLGREDVLPAGLYILDEVMERFNVDHLLSSESDILDGITSALLGP